MPEQGEPKNKSEDELVEGLEPTKDLPVLDPETERLDKLMREKELKRRKKELREKIKSAQGLDDVLRALGDTGFTSLAGNIKATIRELKLLVKEKDPAQLTDTIESILNTGDLFKGASFDVGDAYLTKKIRQHLVEYMRQEAGAI